MSTRARTRAAASASAAASVAKPESSTSAQKPLKPIGQVRKSVKGNKAAEQIEKENVNGKSVQGVAKKGRSKATTLKPVHCMCSMGDDGSPMILCSECKIWYHFTCVDISEPEAEEIGIYICPSCTETSGRCTTFEWEGPDAVEECVDDGAMVVQRRKAARARMRRPDIKFEPEESEEEASSEDEYVAEDSQSTGRFRRANKRQKRQDSSSDSDLAASDDQGASKPRSISNVPLSPGPTPQVQRKRKTTNASEVTPASKRKKAAEVEAADDPIRKYCLGKLEELFRDIFLRYPHVRVKIEEGGQGQKSVIIPKQLEELSDEDKDVLIEESKQFAEGLERCVFEIYSEPDRNGNPQAGGNYKDRFRMLQFNLSKPDRVIIHQRITSANISPKEISLMSSTDLADEETKQSIKIAEKEALAYSILQKATAPRAKITHKGLQDIEDVNGQMTTTRELDPQVERDLEGEERRERERTARLKVVQRQRTESVSVPPESPTVSQTPSESWGAPPPIPPHAVSNNAGEMASPISRPPVNPLFIHTASELAPPTPEPELNLADLINIDDEPTEQESLLPSSLSSLPSMVVDEPMTTEPVALEAPSPSLPLPTGISPFAARAEKSRAMSFDLNALWNAPKSEDASKTATPRSPPLTTTPPLSLSNGDQKDIPMELESEADDEAKDQDFDMFLEDREVEKVEPVNAADVLQAAFDALPHVWTGQISMPLDSTIPQETGISARQVGGKSLAANSPLWKTLFPSSNLRIDGRVPVEGSAKYLLQMRMNAAKELFSVAFTPSSDANESGFKALSDFLTAKSRHGLIFPWGSRPKEHHPGRELYIIPLPATQPLPDYIELLDNLKLPPVRKADYLVGIWILNKGKLAPPPPSPPPPVTVPALPAHLSIPSFNAAIVPPTTASAPPVPPPPPPPPILPNLPPIVPAALAAEVASLTPEQIQNVLKALAGATPLLPSAPPAQVPQQFRPPPQNPPLPPVQHPRVQMPPSHAQPPPPQVPQRFPPPPTTQHQQATWPPQPSPYPSNYPPMQQPNMPPYRGPPQPPPPSVYDRQDYGRDSRADVVYERERGGGDRGDRPQHDRGGSRGWRGGNRGRGKGWESPPRPIDSGWPRRGRGGGPASNSPPRRW